MAKKEQVPNEFGANSASEDVTERHEGIDQAEFEALKKERDELKMKLEKAEGKEKRGQKRKPTRITFMSKKEVRCPVCKSTNTIAVSTNGIKQYRQCREEHCGHSFFQLGEEVEC